MTTVVKTGLGQNQLSAAREKLGRMETRMDAVVETAGEVYGDDGSIGEEENKVVARISRVFDRVRQTKQVVDKAVSKRRFDSIETGDGIGRRRIKERVTREVHEVIDLGTGSEGESGTDEEMEEDESESDESDESDEEEQEEYVEAW
jgi:hypothetical protein